jgi:hypothetical protein
MIYTFFTIQEKDKQISDPSYVPNENQLYLGEYFNKSIFTTSALNISILNRHFKINELNIKKLKTLQKSDLNITKLLISDNETYSGYVEYNKVEDCIEVFDYDIEPNEFKVNPKEIYELYNQLQKFLIKLKHNKTKIKTNKLT